MSTYLVSPNSDDSGGTKWGAIDDAQPPTPGSMSSSVPLTAGGAALGLGFDLAAVPTVQSVTSIKVWTYGTASAGQPQVALSVNSGGSYGAWQNHTQGGSAAWSSTVLAGGPWTDSQLRQMRVRLQHTGAAAWVVGDVAVEIEATLSGGRRGAFFIVLQ